jgi:hypothetical protein
MNDIKTLDYIKDHASGEHKLTKIDIYRGFIDPDNRSSKLLKVKEIRPDQNGNFENGLEHFSQQNIGNFTVYFPGSRTWHYFSNQNDSAMNGTNFNYQNIPTEEQIQAQVQKILENERLKMRLQELEDEKDENDMWGQRMGVAMNMLLDRFIGGNSSQSIPVSEPALQGTDGEPQLNPTEAALVILVNSFGEEWLQKFAAKIKSEPHLINQIKSFFS